MITSLILLSSDFRKFCVVIVPFLTCLVTEANPGKPLRSDR